MVKHLLNISDRETIIAIQENIYIQHFLGFDSIVYEEPFNASLFVEIRKRMGMEHVEQINNMIYKHSQKKSIHHKESTKKKTVGTRTLILKMNLHPMLKQKIPNQK